jgi:hypothetical protein
MPSGKSNFVNSRLKKVSLQKQTTRRRGTIISKTLAIMACLKPLHFAYFWSSRRWLGAWCAFALLILPAGCERNDKIVTFRAPKDPAPMAMDNTAETLALPQMPGGTYAKPESWVVRQPHELESMRFSTSDASDTACTLTILSTFDWQPNVVRWETKQVEVKETSPDALPSMLKPVTVGGMASQKMELQGSEKRLVVTVVPMNGQFYVFKILGPIDEVKGAQADYDAFLRSLQFGTAAAPSPSSSASPQTSDSAAPPFTWTAPPSWKADPDQIEFRTAGWTVGSGASQAEITISSAFTASNFDLSANMEQWRTRVGLPATTDGKDVQPTTTQIGDQPAMEIDLTGPATAGKQPRRMIVAFVGNQSLYFFKITGPADVVAQQKQAFDQFLANVKFKAVP